MDHNDYHVQILNEQGMIVGSKRRGDIEKTKDVVRVVHVLLRLPDGKFVLSVLPTNDAIAPGAQATTAATMVRTGETRHDAAKRALVDEILLAGVVPERVGEIWIGVEKLAPRRVALFLATVPEAPKECNPRRCGGLVTMMGVEIDAALQHRPEQFAATFTVLWKQFRDKLGT